MAEQRVFAKQDFIACVRIYVVWGYKKFIPRKVIVGQVPKDWP